MVREIKIEMYFGEMRKEYLPILKEFGFKEKISTIYVRHIDDIFELQNKLNELNLNTTFRPSIIIDEDGLWIYDDYIE